MKNKDVIRRFTVGREGRTKSLKTDGIIIRSYDLVIGFNLGGYSYAIDYTSLGGHWKSQTTSVHVNSLKRESGVKVICVEEWEVMFSKQIDKFY